MPHQAIEIGPGAVYHPAYLNRAAQQALLADIRAVIAAAPLYHPRMPRSGKEFSVRMTNCGRLAWASDIGGYRYQKRHPGSAAPCPDLPATLRAPWGDL